MGFKGNTSRGLVKLDRVIRIVSLFSGLFIEGFNWLHEITKTHQN